MTQVETLYFINETTGDKYKHELERAFSDQWEGEEWAERVSQVRADEASTRSETISEANEVGYKLVTMTEYYRFNK